MFIIFRKIKVSRGTMECYMTLVTPPLVDHMFGALAAHLAQSITTWAWVQMYVITLGMFVMILPAFINDVLVH